LADGNEPIVKPANFPSSSPGKDYTIVMAGGVPVAIVSIMGRTYMRAVDCPYAAMDRVLKEIEGKAKVILVDMHAEATADKYLLGRFLDGRVTAVLGTHTHVSTADEQIFPGRTKASSAGGSTACCTPHARSSRRPSTSPRMTSG
jgi:calcineurin-like phosphoesterase